MVIDLSKVHLNEEIEDGALWVVEQIPGLVLGQDQTGILRAGNVVYSRHGLATSPFYSLCYSSHIFSRIFDSSYVLSCGHDFKLAV